MGKRAFDRAGTSFTSVQRRGWRASLSLTLLRLALAPAFILCARLGTRGWILALMLVIGFASDVFDGVVARRYGAITPFLRRLDSTADTIFYLAVAYSAWVLYPQPLRALAWPISIVLAGEAANYLVAAEHLACAASATRGGTPHPA